MSSLNGFHIPRLVFTKRIKLGYCDWPLTIIAPLTQCHAKHVYFEDLVENSSLSSELSSYIVLINLRFTINSVGRVHDSCSRGQGFESHQEIH